MTEEQNEEQNKEKQEISNEEQKPSDISEAQAPVVEQKTEEKSADKPVTPAAEEEEEDDLTGIEEATEEEIVQKVTKKIDPRKKRKKGRERSEKGKEASEWIEKVVQIRRVTKVVKGGKKLSFRAVVIVGNGKGQVGVGVGKASEVISAIQKAVVDAKKHLITVPLIGATVPHQIIGRAGASKVLLKPAREGTGIKAGGAARTVLELGGIGDILSKSLGSRSPLNVARATLDGILRLRKFEEVAKLRDMTVKDMVLAK